MNALCTQCHTGLYRGIDWEHGRVPIEHSLCYKTAINSKDNIFYQAEIGQTGMATPGSEAECRYLGQCPREYTILCYNEVPSPQSEEWTRVSANLANSLTPVLSCNCSLPAARNWRSLYKQQFLYKLKSSCH